MFTLVKRPLTRAEKQYEDAELAKATTEISAINAANVAKYQEEMAEYAYKSLRGVREDKRSQDFSWQVLDDFESLENKSVKPLIERVVHDEEAGINNVFSHDGIGVWNSRANMTLKMTNQEYLWLGWANKQPCFIRGDFSHAYIIGGTGEGKTSLGFLPLMTQFLMQTNFRKEDKEHFKQNFEREVTPIIVDGFINILKNRLSINILLRCIAYEKYKPSLYDNEEKKYRHKQTFSWKNQSFIKDFIQNIIKIPFFEILGDNKNRKKLNFMPSETLFSKIIDTINNDFKDFVLNRIEEFEQEEFLALILKETIEDVTFICDVIDAVLFDMRDSIVRKARQIIDSGTDELLFRAGIQTEILRIFSAPKLKDEYSQVIPGIFHIIPEIRDLFVKLENLAFPNIEQYKYSMIVIDLKGDELLFNSIREQCKSQGRAFKFFQPDLNKETYTYNPFDILNYERLYFTNASQVLSRMLGLIGNLGKEYFTAREIQWMTRVLRDAYKQRKPIHSFSQLLELANKSMEDNEVEHINHLIANLEMVAEIQQLNDIDFSLENRDSKISISESIKNKEVLYFWLPDGDSPLTSEMVAKQVLDEVYRCGNKSTPVLLFIDEFQRIVSNNITTAINQARSKGVRLFLANQTIDALEGRARILRTVWTNTDLKLVFSARDPATIAYLTEASGTKFELVTTSSSGGSSTLAHLHGTTLSSSSSVTQNYSGGASTESGGSSTQNSSTNSNSINWNVSTTHSRVPYLESNDVLDMNARRNNSIAFVQGYHSVISRNIDAKHPFVVMHEHMTSKEESVRLESIPWPSQEEFPAARKFHQIEPNASYSRSEYGERKSRRRSTNPDSHTQVNQNAEQNPDTNLELMKSEAIDAQPQTEQSVSRENIETKDNILNILERIKKKQQNSK